MPRMSIRKTAGIGLIVKKNVGLFLVLNNPYRDNYAGIGYYYNKELDAFIPPKSSDSAMLDTNTFQWIEP